VVVRSFGRCLVVACLRLTQLQHADSQPARPVDCGTSAVSGKAAERSVTCMHKVRGYCSWGMPATFRSRIFCRPFYFLKTKITIYRTIIVSLLYWDETWSHVREEHMVVDISQSLS
jgi:hypothetical protein